MKELIICKSCGFIMVKSNLKTKCPACGVPAKLFEPYVENLSPKRKFILSLDTHPILVHFPQAFITSILILSAVALFAHGSLKITLAATITVLGFALPFVVIASFCSGLLDGKIRFHRVTTPILRRKILFGILFFVFSCGIFAVILSQPMTSTTPLLTVAGISLPALGCASMLGLLGTSILNAKFPG